ncbi:hypothetical protein EDB19DRAFT_1914324 [Suillus lakei]|nr:hypothetical protein EDB19DRAFT_1914324 [Suillus lakei]
MPTSLYLHHTPKSKESLSMDADLARLETQLNRIASKHDLSAEDVLEDWLERRKSYDSESWRLLDGLPCIMGGLTALCGKPQWAGKTPSCLVNFATRTQKGKGINDLTLRERGIFPVPYWPLANLSSMARLLDLSHPTAFGRRMFVNGRIDRKGPSRLTLDESSPCPFSCPFSRPFASSSRPLRVLVLGPTSHLKESQPRHFTSSPWALLVVSPPFLVLVLALLVISRKTTTAGPSRIFVEVPPAPTPSPGPHC